MSDETRMDDLLSRWQSRLAVGEELTAKELCRECPELRPEIERRLQALRQMQQMADTPDGSGTSAMASSGRRGATPWPNLPGYEILDELGRGGMGVVYKAHQTALKRLVALKMILGGGLAGSEQHERFRAEAEVVARLKHANIVEIHEIGVVDGQPYFSLEFVTGGSLEKKLRGTPLPPAQAAALVETLARTMHHAHRQGVLHRDLKPANILLTPGDGPNDLGTAKITDFGLAKQLDTDGQTASGAIMGTPSYMAPEQAAGKIKELGPACDIYALGAILYECLTGRPPFRAASVMETLRQVIGDEPVSPRRLNPPVPRDLETICLKCLHKEPPRRYASAAALADDLRRFQTGEPVMARPVGQLERGWRWCRRRPASAALVALLVGTAIALLGAAFQYQANAAEEARWLAVTERASRQSLGDAQHTRQKLVAVLQDRGGVQRLLNQPAQWEMQLNAARAQWQRARDQLGRAEDELPECLSSVQEFEAVLDQDKTDYELTRGLEKIRLDRATWKEGGFDHAQALHAYPQVFQRAGLVIESGRQQQIAESIRQSPIKEQWLAALDDWAFVAHRQKDTALCSLLLEVARYADPDPWRDRVRHAALWKNPPALTELADEAQRQPRFLARLSPQMVHLLGLLMPEGRDERWLRAGQRDHSGDFWINFQLALILGDAKKPAECAGFYRVALAIRPSTVAVYNNLGAALRDAHDLDGAADAYTRALAIDANLVSAWNNLGNVRKDRNDLAGAALAYRKALTLDPGLARAWYNLGIARRAQNDLPGAAAAYEKALTADRKLAPAWNNLGLIRFNQNDVPGAIDAYRHAVAIEPKNAAAWTNLGTALGQQKDFHAAIDAYKQAVASAPNEATYWGNLGGVLYHHNQFAAAVDAFQEAVRLKPDYAEAHLFLGQATRNTGDFAAALQSLQRAHALGSRQASWRYPSATLLKECQRLVALDGQLPAVLQGKEVSAGELLALAELCQRYKQRYRDAAALYTRAFAAAKTGTPAVLRYRYHAARAAVAATSHDDARTLTEREKSDLRKKALAWLRADLEDQARHLRTAPAAAVEIQETLRQWPNHADLAPVVSSKKLAALSDDERAAWQQLWARADALAKQARDSYTETEHPGQLTADNRELLYLLNMTAGKSYVIDMSSAQFDTYLRLEDHQGKVVAENDDISPQNLNSRIVYTAPAAGAYRIVATSYQERGRGAYTVTIREFPGGNP